jgi:hypothetical protein
VDSATGTPIIEHAINATTNNPNGHNVPVNPPRSPMTPDAPLTPVRPGKTSSTPTSRSASFSLPDEKSGSGRLRKIVSPGGTPGQQMGEEVEEEDGDVEDKDFKKKRAGHYGGEAEAMKLAQVRG